MSDSGFPPSTGSKIGPQSFPPSHSDGKPARVENATGELRHIAKPTRLDGEIVRHNRDGSVRIRTDKGEIDIRLRSRELPPVGQKVEIDIPAGKPPRQIIVRDAPPTPDQTPRPDTTSTPKTTQQRTEPETTSSRPNTNTNTTSRPQPRVTPDAFSSGITPQSDAPPPQVSLKPQDIVRLLPLPRDGSVPVTPSTEQIIQQTVQQITESIRFTATLHVEAVQNDQLNNLIAVKKDPAPPLPVEALPRIPVTALAAPQTDLVLQPPLTQQPALPPPVITAFTQSVLPLVQPTTAAAPTFLSPAPVILNTAPLVTQSSPENPQLPPQTALITPKPTVLTFLPFDHVVQTLQDTAPPLRLLPVSAQTDTTPQKSNLFVFKIPSPALLHHQPTPAPPDDLQALLKPALFFKPAAETSPLPLPQTETSFVTPGKPEKIPEKIDVRITAITPPSVQLVAPTAGNNTAAPAQHNDSTPAAPDTRTTLPKILQTLHETPVTPLISQEKAGNITASVIGTTPEQLPVLSFTLPNTSYETIFALQIPANNIPPGTIVELTPITGTQPLTHSGAPPSIMAVTTPTPAFELFSTFQWPALEEMTQVLRQQSEIRTIQSMARTVASNPANPTRLPAAALFFIAAVRSGDIANWLGEKTTDLLRRAGRSDVINRLSRDAAGLQRADSAPVSQDWRGMALPLYWDNEFQKMMLWYREDQSQNDNDQEQKRGARFIFDLNLNRMGAVQLDGLFRPKKLDLIIRTHTAFSQTMQQAMRKTYINALEQADLSGELSFQSKKEKFVKIDIQPEKFGTSA